MNQGKYIFSQVMEFVHYYQFNKCVGKYKGHYRLRSLTCYEQFMAMAFGQLSYRESLRDVVVCLQAQESKLYHFGFRSKVTRPTLARMNEKRDWRIYRDFAQILIEEARGLYTNSNELELDLEGACYAIDSSTIELCLNVYKWARLIKKRAAVRLHLQMDLNGNIPTFFDITTARTHDINFLDSIDIEAGAYYIMDRGYIDYERLNYIHRQGAFFVVRAKNNFSFKRIYSAKVDKSIGLRCDQTVRLTGYYSAKDYPDKLRRIKYFDSDTNKRFVFLTNDFNIEARTITELYKNRWQIELFFKWIKQHLKIKSFWGYSKNAVKSQICIAICVYLLVAIIRKKLKIERNLYEILQILSVSLFDKMPLHKLISEATIQSSEEQSQKQQCLWDFK
jgi:hypothetical protein